ncbi:MAG: PhzF family phenazine biosynthesis protein [Gammaproteobacteria bacterium]|nr:PhzF family phenazine biosynthesis protein [Gammaproteobacteria bacterium]
MTKPTFFITDVFAACKYGGNPLAIFVDCESLSDQEMQQIAKEINFSETTFITSRQPKEGGYVLPLPKTASRFLSAAIWLKWRRGHGVGWYW